MSARSMRVALLYLFAALLVLPAAASAQSSPSDFTSAVRYDGSRRVVGTIAPDPDGATGPLRFAAVRNTFDDAGNLVLVEKGQLTDWQSEAVLPSAWPTWNGTSGFQVFAKVETAYDVMDRKTLETAWGWDAATSAFVRKSVTQFSYDGLGRLECTAVRMNPTTWSSLPSSACTLATTSSIYGPDRITKTTYDVADQPLKVTKAYGQTTANGLEPLQQDYVTYTYTLNGKVATVKDANGNLAGYTYDGFDRLVKWSFPDKTTTGAISSADYEAYGYDANGNRTSLRKRDGRTLTYSYDALNRVTMKVVPDDCVSGYACTTPSSAAVRDVYYGYDLRGLQLYARFDSATGPDGVVDIYDGYGRLTSEAVSMGGTSRTVTYGYDLNGNRKRVAFPDGMFFMYTFDGLDRMTIVKLGNTTTIATVAYDAQSREVSETRGNVTTTFGYDPVSRLASLGDDLPGTTGDVTTTLDYNPSSQIVTKTRSNASYGFTGYVNVSRSYAVNGLNQYTTGGSATFGYDSNGNLVSDGTVGYTYDVENRLIADQAGTTLTYDTMGRLYSVGNASGTESYIYAGNQRIAEYDANGAMTARYVFGDGQDNPLLWYVGSATTAPRALQGDTQGSIVSVVDASGTIVGINSYDEYGIPGAGNVGRFQYTGQAWMPQLGLYYYKARMYSPTLGRFLQTDPIGYEDQNNLYTYAGNDPVNATDPTGEETSYWSNLPLPPSEPLSPEMAQLSLTIMSNTPLTGQVTRIAIAITAGDPLALVLPVRARVGPSQQKLGRAHMRENLFRLVLGHDPTQPNAQRLIESGRNVDVIPVERKIPEQKVEILLVIISPPQSSILLEDSNVTIHNA